VIVIHHGRILFDGQLASLAGRFGSYKTIGVRLDGGDPAVLANYGEVVGEEDGMATLRVTRAEAPAVTARLLSELAVADLTVEDPPIEEVIELVFAEEQVG
jgi:ABC-2 type transport system ATP-binding protein